MLSLLFLPTAWRSSFIMDTNLSFVAMLKRTNLKQNPYIDKTAKHFSSSNIKINSQTPEYVSCAHSPDFVNQWWLGYLVSIIFNLLTMSYKNRNHLHYFPYILKGFQVHTSVNNNKVVVLAFLSIWILEGSPRDIWRKNWSRIDYRISLLK